MSQWEQGLPDLEKLQAGDEAAWDAAFPILWGIGLKVARQNSLHLSLEDAEDIVSFSIPKLFELVHSVRDKRHLVRCLVKITQQRAISVYREKYADKRGVELTESLEELEEGGNGLQAIPADTLSPLDFQELMEILKRTLEELDNRSRDIIWDQLVLGFSQHEIAERYGIPQGTVGSTVKRGLEKLREKLKQKPKLLQCLEDFLRY